MPNKTMSSSSAVLLSADRAGRPTVRRRRRAPAPAAGVDAVPRVHPLEQIVAERSEAPASGGAGAPSRSRRPAISVMVSSGDVPDGAGWRRGRRRRVAAGGAVQPLQASSVCGGDGPAGPVRGEGRRQGRGGAGREQARRGVGMPARVVLPAAVPIYVIVARPAPSAGVRSSARRLREARRAGRPMDGVDVGCGAPGGLCVDAVWEKACRSSLSVSALDTASTRCVCGETAPSRSTSERRTDRASDRYRKPASLDGFAGRLWRFGAATVVGALGGGTVASSRGIRGRWSVVRVTLLRGLRLSDPQCWPRLLGDYRPISFQSERACDPAARRARRRASSAACSSPRGRQEPA